MPGGRQMSGNYFINHKNRRIMANNEIKYTLNVQLADNTVTVDNNNDKIAVLMSASLTTCYC